MIASEIIVASTEAKSNATQAAAARNGKTEALRLCRLRQGNRFIHTLKT